MPTVGQVETLEGRPEKLPRYAAASSLTAGVPNLGAGVLQPPLPKWYGIILCIRTFCCPTFSNLQVLIRHITGKKG